MKLIGNRFCFLSYKWLFNDSLSLGGKLINSSTKEEKIITFIQENQTLQGKGKARGGNKDFQLKLIIFYFSLLIASEF